MTSTATLVGATGLVGSHILTHLLTHPSISHTTTISRRPPAATSSTLTPLLHPTLTFWPALVPPSTHFFSSLGTTRAAAGSLASQRAIDLDANLLLARAARSQGVRTYVLISTAGARAGSWVSGYADMKGRLEEGVIGLGFERTVILRPGLILGGREERRVLEAGAQMVARGLGRWGERWAVGAERIARAAVRAGVEEGLGVEWVRNQAGGVVAILSHEDILKLSAPEEEE